MSLPRTLIVLGILLLCSCSRVITIDSNIKPVLITDLDSMADEYVTKLKKDGLLVKFDTGDVIPVEVTSHLPFATLESGKNQLVFSQATFVYLSKDGAFVSPDGIHFAAVYDGKALKKLYPAKNGTLSIGFSISREEGAKLKTDVSLQ